jgi:hypothetical protein
MLHQTKVVIHANDLGEVMAKMRSWLDDHRYEPDTFRCVIAAKRASVSVEFKVQEEAAAFAEQFDGACRPGAPGDL